jgi:hypothetical protein
MSGWSHARGGAWDVLNQSYDPVPGDPDSVHAQAANYGSIARAIQNAQTALESAFADGALTGGAIDALREEALQVADRIGRAHTRYQVVSDALADYVEPLRTARDDSWHLLTLATASHDDLDYARARVVYWRGEEESARDAENAEDETYAHGRLVYWEGQEAALSNAIWGYSGQLLDVLRPWEAAANTAADLIEAGNETGDLNDGFWENLDQWFEENPWVDDVMYWVGWVGAVLAVVAMFIPGLNFLVYAIIAVTILVTVLQMCSGNKPLLEGLLTIALTLIPLKLGRVLEGTMSATATTVARSGVVAQMASHAGSGLSGMTRPAAEAVVAAARSGAAPAIIQGTGRELLEVIAVATLPMVSEKLAPSVTRLVMPALGVFGLNIANEIVPPLIELGVESSQVLDPLSFALDFQNHDW